MPRVDEDGARRHAAERIVRTEAYAEKIRKMFAATVNAIAALPVTPPDISNGEMYSFDGDTPRIRKEVEQLLRHLYSAAQLAIEKGIEVEWERANADCQALIRQVYGSRLLRTDVMKGWNERNRQAQRQFIRRSDNGMNLSQRVWQSCRQLRDEMEVALTVSIGEGQDARTISKSIRQYLNEPELMFRRFRYKDANGVWQTKWKKKERDPVTGRVTFRDYDKDAYNNDWTGAGYYKSSAQNAMRVARTETNIAYRRADHERWQQMEFVLGVRVQLSKNHPREDICDELAGDYPKEFVFDGWHPQCFCFATPILMDPSEILKVNEAKAKGETYTPKGKVVRDYPQRFKDWCRDNRKKIEASQARGTEPYFIRNNASIVSKIWDEEENGPQTAPEPQRTEPTEPVKPTIPSTREVAEKRWAARTPEQIEEIKKRWEESRKKNEPIREMIKDIETSRNIDYLKVRDLEKDLTEVEIITKLSGGDLTKGSCVSLAHAYAANRCGYDVTDYRGGDSCRIFSLDDTNKKIISAVGGVIEKDYNDLDAADRLFAKIEKGKEYLLGIGKHAAIVRRNEDGELEYLELQSPYVNGFKPLNKKELKRRFKAQKSHTVSRIKIKWTSYLIDVSLLKGNAAYKKLLGYLNTQTDKQQKGKMGTIK